MSQIQLSRDTGVAQATISNIENNKRTPSYLTRQRLANTLGFSVEEIFPNDGSLVKKGRGKSAAMKANTIGDILISNSQQSLSLTPIKNDAKNDTTYLIRDNKLIGFIFSIDGMRLKYFPIRLFKGEEFLSGTYTDAIGKFSFDGLKSGEYTISTDEKSMKIKIKP